MHVRVHVCARAGLLRHRVGVGKDLTSAPHDQVHLLGSGISQIIEGMPFLQRCPEHLLAWGDIRCSLGELGSLALCSVPAPL